MKKLRSLLLGCLGLMGLMGLGGFAASPAAAQGTAPFPNKPVVLVVPFTSGSGSDIISRIIGPRLQARWGQPVVVDNKPGASGNLGASYVAKAAPDGYTLLMAINTITMTPALYKNTPFDPASDFTPITKLSKTSSFSILVNPSFPATDMKSLIAQVKAHPGQFNYASPGNGTPHHLAMELFKSNLGLNIVHVPYKGIAGAVTELMGGQVQMMFATVSSVLPQVRAGKLRMLGVTGESRSELVPDVPTFREQGITSIDDVDGWYALMGPPHMPAQLVARLRADFDAVLHMPEVEAEMARQGLKPDTGTPEQLRTLIKSDMVRWAKVVNDAGIKAD